MLKLAVFCTLLAICSIYAEEDVPPSSRIVNGQDAREGEFRYAVSLRRLSRHTCGATIINERFILTAAHCCCDENRPLNAAEYSIQYGSVHITETNERTIPVQRIICHDYDSIRIINDVAVIELQHSLPYDGTWEPVRLARNYDSSRAQNGVVIGWGRLWQNGPIPTILQKLDVRIFTDAICSLRFDTFHHICFEATNAGVCNGDSGTSLVVDGEQIGVASFITTTCGTSNWLLPNVYARVPSYLSWIEQHSRL